MADHCLLFNIGAAVSVRKPFIRMPQTNGSSRVLVIPEVPTGAHQELRHQTASGFEVYAKVFT